MFAPGNLTAITEENRRRYRGTERLLVSAVAQDPEVEHPTNLSVFIREQSGSPEVHLIGKVPTKREYERVEEIVSTNVKDEMAVVNEIVVDAD
jgi:hypothetical protein